MPSRLSAGRDVARACALAALLAAAAPCLGADAAPTQAEIERAVAAVKADPALASEKPVRTLRWSKKTKQEATPPKSRRMPGWLTWLGDFFSWIAQASRLLMWILIAVLLGLLAMFVVRFVGSRSGTARAPRFYAPTHVQDLDIRPESLPDDIGAAARALWDGGRQRAALALLYRGLLSRLAHTHRVPIRDSSTEGDCLALAAGVLDAQTLAYATRLVRVWQGATYGGTAVETAVAHELCAGFAAHLDSRSNTRGAAPAGALA